MIWIFVAAFTVLIAVGVVSSAWAETRLPEWAEKNGYEILRIKPSGGRPGRWIRQKPVGGRYYVLLRDENGSEKKAWIDTGGILDVLFRREVSVDWDRTNWNFDEK